MSKEKKTRNATMSKEHTNGLSYRKLGKIYNIHWTRVKQIVKAWEKKAVDKPS